jgi:hypothetical protein
MARLKEYAREHSIEMETIAADPRTKGPSLVVTRYNRKTATVTDGGQHWNVAPGLLRRADSRDGTD